MPGLLRRRPIAPGLLCWRLIAAVLQRLSCLHQLPGHTCLLVVSARERPCFEPRSHPSSTACHLRRRRAAAMHGGKPRRS